jgi:transcription antitermination factor NusG
MALSKAGDQVNVAAGDFADFVATVEQINSDKRGRLLLDFLGRSTRVAINPTDLRVSQGLLALHRL